MKHLSLILLALTFALSLSAQELRGRVVAITDGDTLKVLTAGNIQIKVRLDGIDAPEKAQDFGHRSKEALSDLCFGKTVTILTNSKDKYGRTLGTIILEDGTNVNATMIKNGYAWHYKKYSDDEELAALEDAARDAAAGLWSQPNPIPPWDFRHGNKTSGISPQERN